MDFYEGDSTKLTLNGEEFYGLPLTGGLRQGCPISGSIFVIALHTLHCEISARIAAYCLLAPLRIKTSAYTVDLAAVSA